MKKYISFSILASIAIFLAGSNLVSADDSGWQNVGSCVPTDQCGSNVGSQNQSRVVTTRECENGCPEYTFTTNRQIVDVAEYYVYAEKVVDVQGYWSCENNWTLYWSDFFDKWRCQKNGHNDRKDAEWISTTYKCPEGYESNPGQTNCRKLIPATYKTENYSKTFTYEKSQDPNHCHKPTPQTLGIPEWARGAYGSNVPELANFTEINCHDVSRTETRTIECQLEQSTPACEDPRTHVCLDEKATNYDSDFNSDTEVEDQSVCKYDNEPEPTPTPTPNNGDVCANLDGIQTSLPEGYHFDNAGVNCLQFSVPGVEQPTGGSNNSQPQVLGASTMGGGKVLGTSTMAKTGMAEDAIFNSVFALGSLLTSFGIMKNGKKKA
jgi:hypothetical protein